MTAIHSLILLSTHDKHHGISFSSSAFQRSNTNQSSLHLQASYYKIIIEKMAVAAAATSALTVASTVLAYNHGISSKPKMNKVYCVRGLKSYAGLKPENKVMNLGVAVDSDKQFARLVTMCRALKANSGGGRGGALASTCNVASEIATIVPIMSALVLIGVAVGFVLLRVEAAVEESEE